jgi:hypothetical protein
VALGRSELPTTATLSQGEALNVAV